jgi:hypothetical protein
MGDELRCQIAERRALVLFQIDPRAQPLSVLGVVKSEEF